MGKGLLAWWRRRIVARGVAGAVLLAVPVAVAALIGFGTSLSGVAGGLSSVTSGPDASAVSAPKRPSSLSQAVVSVASKQSPAGTSSGAANGGGSGGTPGTSIGTGTGSGSGSGASGGSSGSPSTPTINTPSAPNVPLPGAGSSSGTSDQVNGTVNNLLGGVNNTVNGLLGR
jgi:hypothetical protein